MSEHVHVHAPHEFTESEAAPSVRSERIMELVATLLLAIATLGIAWSGYQGARWNGRQAEEYSAANGVHSGANRATTQGRPGTHAGPPELQPLARGHDRRQPAARRSLRAPVPARVPARVRGVARRRSAEQPGGARRARCGRRSTRWPPSSGPSSSRTSQTSTSRTGRKPPSTPTRTCSLPCSSPPCCSSPGSRCGSSGNACASPCSCSGRSSSCTRSCVVARLPIL